MSLLPINEDFESGIASFVNDPSNDEDWIVDTDDKKSGLFSATTIGSLSDDEISTVSYSITIPIGSVNPELSFYFKTDTEDKLNIFRLFLRIGKTPLYFSINVTWLAP